MNVHLNADVPTPNSVPTVRAMDYVTLAEFCRVAGLDFDDTFQILSESPVTYGGSCGEMTFVSAANLSRVLRIACPESVECSVAVWLG